MIGKLDKSFVADVTATAEVWNQPVRGYEILKKEPISKADAMKKYFTSSNSTTYTFNTKADSLVFVRTRFLYIVESNDNRSGLEDEYTTSKTYEYLLELDAQKNIIGGEWVGYSRLDHPDFFWLATETPKSANVGGIKYAEVKKLVEKSAKATC